MNILKFCTWVEVLAVSASLLGAIFSILAALKARKYKNEIINRRKMLESHDLMRETKKIMRELSAIGLASNLHRVQGIDSQQVVFRVKEYAELVAENSDKASDLLPLSKHLIGEAMSLSDAASPQDIKDIAQAIYLEIHDKVPSIKKLSDSSMEKNP